MHVCFTLTKNSRYYCYKWSSKLELDQNYMIGTTQKSMDNMTIRPPAASSNDQWMPLIDHHDHHATEGQPASELMTGGTTDTIISSSNSTPVVLPLTTPKGCSSTGSKPIRRRSRASKRTPTTLLNANTGNFRALVQHYTGCPSPAAAGTISFGNRKEPVNLDFGRGGSSEVENQRIKTSSLMALFGNRNYHSLQQYPDHFQSQGQHRLAEYNQSRHDQQQQLLLQEQQQSMYSISNNISGDVFVSASSNVVVPRPNVEISDGFARLDDDNISFDHELAMNSFSTGFKNYHGGFF
ncbi:hypothetical protein I3842_10G061900 [Carya illinoinensis]|uniref:VQ domain-containing protein n=1 Tax=Carya illinoinensis TaxID=32201 RepID=A0A922DV04_CARIL|nr:hypothetical protein I3842_10G061900 [Carya illinoinensis]